MPTIKIHTKDDFDHELKTKKNVIVDFGAVAWCGPCRRIKPTFESLAEEHPDITFLDVDVDENPDIAQQYVKEGIPLFVSFMDGEVKGTVVGASSEKLTELVQSLKQ